MTDKIKQFWNGQKEYPTYFAGYSDNVNFGQVSTCKEEMLKKIYGKRGATNGKIYLAVHTSNFNTAIKILEGKNIKFNYAVINKSKTGQLLELDIKKDFKYPAQLDLFLTTLRRHSLVNSFQYNDWGKYFVFMFNNAKNLDKIPYSLICPPNSYAEERGMYEVLRNRRTKLEEVLKK